MVVFQTNLKFKPTDCNSCKCLEKNFRCFAKTGTKCPLRKMPTREKAREILEEIFDYEDMYINEALDKLGYKDEVKP